MPVAGMISYLLRAHRADPGGLAADDDRRRALATASLQQFEDLLAAAREIGPEARPLPLFYALSQAGRAILAIRSPDAADVADENDSHGLSTGRAPSEPHEYGLLLTKQRPNSPGRARQHFQRVAAAVGSPAFFQETELGALLASLPEMTDYWPWDDWPIAASVEHFHNTDDPTNEAGLLTTIAIDKDAAPSLESIETLGDRYPTIRPFRPEVYNGAAPQPARYYTIFTPIGHEAVQVVLHLPHRDPANALNEFAPEYRWIGRRWMRPSFDGSSPPPNPLMTWWLVLHALSNLARYQPVAWTAATDLNRSSMATALERALDIALEAIPHLLLEALANPPGKQFLLPPGPDSTPVQR
jgi:hypothetical protein